jgi:hypothetical protein
MEERSTRSGLDRGAAAAQVLAVVTASLLAYCLHLWIAADYASGTVHWDA